MDRGNVKEGDWYCPNCSYHNFASRRECFKCSSRHPLGGRGFNKTFRKGDWVCPSCDFHNFASQNTCKQCEGLPPLKKGDWICSGCSFKNFAYRTNCFKCGEEKSQKAIEGGDSEVYQSGRNQDVTTREGDWSCPECSVVNFSYRMACFKCHCKNPNPQAKTMPPEPKEHRQGDWTCAECNMMNFAFRNSCKGCFQAKPMEC